MTRREVCRLADHFLHTTAPAHCFSMCLQDQVKSQRPSHPSNGSMTTSPFMRSRQIWICTQPGIHNKAKPALNEEQKNICWSQTENPEGDLL